MSALQLYGQDTVQTGGRGSPNAISPASDGQNYSQQSGVATPSIVSVGGLNRIQLTGDSVANVFFLGTRQFTDFDLYVRVSVSAAEVCSSLIGRAASANTYYRASVVSGLFTIDLNNNGNRTILAAMTVPYAAATYYWLHLRIQGFGASGSNPNNLLANLWADPTGGTSLTPTGEPDGWMLSASDGTLTAPGSFGFAYTAAHPTENATFDSFTATDCPPPANLPMALLGTSLAQSTSINPYGVTYFVASSPPPFPQQLASDLVGPNPISAVGWGPGANCRYQLLLNVIYNQQGFADWALLDHAVQLCNASGVRIFFSLASPPSSYLMLDAMGSDATLVGTYTPGHNYTSITISTLRSGAYLPHGYQIAINKAGATEEKVYIWNPGGVYTAGAASIGISSSQTALVAWNPANNHNAGEPVREASRSATQFANAADMAAFATAIASRYNGLSGYGKIDVFQVENENYDINQRAQGQGAFNTAGGSPPTWDGSSAWDNGGAILAPVYVAVKNAIAAVAGHSETPVFAGAVRKTPTTGRQHIQNWIEGFVQGVLALGGTIDGVDFHFYCGLGRTDWNGQIINDPTISTYTDSSQTQINAPSIAVELADLQTIFARHNISPQIACCEFGWDIYDDGGGANAATTATYTIGSPTTTLSVDAATWAHGSKTGGVQINDGTPIYVDYNNPNSAEVVYAYGTIAAGSSSLPITTNPHGSQAAQAAWTPANTHAAGIIVYCQTSIAPVSQTVAAGYLEDMYDALEEGGATYGFVFTINPPVSNVNTNHSPPSAQNTKGLTTTTGGVYAYTAGYVATARYAVAHPFWPGVVSGGDSLYTSTVLADSPLAWWRLDESAGNMALDSSSNHNDTTLSGTITRGQQSALVSDVTESTQFAGPAVVDVPRTFGGTLIGLHQPGAGIVFPANCDPSSWSAATLEFWGLFGDESDWRYIAVSNGTNGLLCYLDGMLSSSAVIQGLLGLSGTFSMGQAVGFLKAVTATCTIEEVAVYPMQLSALRIAAHYQSGSGYPVGTPLALYGTNAASTTLPSAGQLATGTGGADVGVATKIGTGQYYGELCALGTNAAWPALAALPDLPTGNGWLLDSPLLSNQQMLAGPWMPTITARITQGNAFVDFFLRVWAYDNQGKTYTPIGTMALPGQQLTTTHQVYAFNPTSLPTFTFNAHQKLYMECWLSVTQNNSGSAKAQINVKLATNAGAGVANDLQVTTPGYVAASAVSTAYTAYISGQPVFVEAGSLAIDSQIGQRSTAQFTVYNSKAGLHFQQYSRVAIYDASGVLAFSGYVDQPKETKSGFHNSLETQIQCVDQHWLADKRRLSATFTNKSIGQIVHAIWKMVLKDEGVKIGQIWNGKVPGKSLLPSKTLVPSTGGVEKIAQATFYYCTVAEALDELVKQASLSGTPFYWQIDAHKRLWFVPYTAVTNSTIIDGTQIDAIQSPPAVTRANPLFRTTQYIVESFNNAGPFNKTIIGDGKTTSWAMDYPLASAPTVTIGGKKQSVGIKGKDKAQWLWAAGDPIIAQGQGAAPLPLNTKAKITYQGQYKDVARYTDQGLVDAQKALDGTTGLIEDAQENPTLAPIAVALKIAKKYVTRYGVAGIQFEFQTRQTGFAAGQWVKVKLPAFGLKGSFLIEKIEASDQQDEFNIWYKLTLVQGPYDSSANYFWKSLLKSRPAANTINVGLTSSSGG